MVCYFWHHQIVMLTMGQARACFQVKYQHQHWKEATLVSELFCSKRSVRASYRTTNEDLLQWKYKVYEKKSFVNLEHSLHVYLELRFSQNKQHTKKVFFNTEKPALENVEFKISKIILLIDKTILLILWYCIDTNNKFCKSTFY